MVNYSCEKCGKTFKQKGHYMKHLQRKTPCDNIKDKIENIVEKKLGELVKEKLQDLVEKGDIEIKNKNLISSNQNSNKENTEMENKYNVISLFSGIGGLDMGFGHNIIVHNNSISSDLKEYIENTEDDNFVKLKKLNYQVVMQNDIMEEAKTLCERNGIENNYVVDSIFNLIKNDYSFPEAEVIIGGFPCQDFSHCGKRKGFDSKKSHDIKSELSEKDHNRGTLYKSYVEVVKRVKPKIFIAENVQGLLTMKGDPIKIIIKDFTELGYDVNYSLVKADEHGIPQRRWRVIIIGILKDRKKQELEKDWHEININNIKSCVGDYISHLKEPNESDDISQQVYSKAKKLVKGQGQVELDHKGISPTIRAEHHGNIEFRRHRESKKNPHENHLPERRLSVRECSLIQTFPPNFTHNLRKIHGNSYKFIGNAVPPLLSYLIAIKVQELLSNYF